MATKTKVAGRKYLLFRVGNPTLPLRLSLIYGLLLGAGSFTVVLLLVTTFDGAERSATDPLPAIASNESQTPISNSVSTPAPARTIVVPREQTIRMIKSLREAATDPIKFLLVTSEQPTSCNTRDGSHLLMMSLKNKIDYCNLHQCKVWYSLESWQPGFTGAWARYPLLSKLMLVNSHIQWFMWMDSDAIFTDMSFDIPFETYESWNKDLIVPGYADKVYGDDPDWLGLNSGIFIIRNTRWSRRFLEKWMSFRTSSSESNITELLNREFKTRPKEWAANDQTVLAHLLRQNQTEHERRTYLEAGYALHGYWGLLVDKFEQMAASGNSDGDNRWPFVTHFCGCKLCTGEYATSQSVRCIASFRRAYNFADNQVLAMAGMTHPDLSSVEVEQLASV